MDQYEYRRREHNLWGQWNTGVGMVWACTAMLLWFAFEQVVVGLTVTGCVGLCWALVALARVRRLWKQYDPMANSKLMPFKQAVKGEDEDGHERMHSRHSS